MSALAAAALAVFGLSFAVNLAVAWIVWRLWRMEAPATPPRHVRATLRRALLPPLLLVGCAALLAMSFTLSRFL